MQFDFQRLLEWLDRPYILIPVGVLCLILGIYWIVRCKTKAIYLYDISGGQVRITHNALTTLIHSVCDGVEAIDRPYVSVKMCGGKLNVTIKLKLNLGHRLLNLSEELQARVTRALQEVLGLERIGTISIIVVGVQGAA